MSFIPRSPRQFGLAFLAGLAEIARIATRP